MNDIKKEPNGWNEWAIWVKTNIQDIKKSRDDDAEKLSEQMEKIYDKIEEIKIEMAVVKTKAGVWGAIAGAIPVLVIVILYLTFN